MDIWVKGLTDSTTEKQVYLFFQPVLARFDVCVFRCEKKRGKGHAVITIADEEKAQKFLSRHGQKKPGPASFSYVASKLFHMNRPVYCCRSSTIPDKYMLLSLQRREKEQRLSLKTITFSKSQKTNKLQRSFNLSNLWCGQYDYEDSQLVFAGYHQAAIIGRLVFANRKIFVSFHAFQPFTGSNPQIHLEVPYFTVESYTTGSIQHPFLTFALRVAPKIFEKIGERNPSNFLNRENSIIEDLISLRLSTKTPKDKERYGRRVRLRSINKDHEAMAGSCLCYRFQLQESTDIGLVQELRQVAEIPDSISMAVPFARWMPSFTTQLTMLNTTLAKESPQSLPFDVRFQFQRLAYNGYLSPYRTVQLFDKLLPYARVIKCDDYAVAITQLQRRLPYRGPDADAGDFSLESMVETILNSAKRSSRESSQVTPATQEHLVLVHKVIVTPAGINLAGPHFEVKNRVLRKYSNFSNHFLSVSFLDEDGELLRHDPHKSSSDRIFYERFLGILEGSITIAGRPFEFLGFSHSSLRAHTCWFMAPFVEDGTVVHARAVIDRLGDFSNFRSPAKTAARIGQAFSQTFSSIDVPVEAIEVICDVERNGYTFSDGVGTCSQAMLEKIWNQGSHNIKPNIYQIRFQGAKGVISLDSTLKGLRLRLRPSMIKFESANASEIEICGSAVKPLTTCLNRQMIKILEDLGVPESAFTSLQAAAVEKLRNATSSASQAADFLNSNNVGVAVKLPWLLRRLEALGLNFNNDDFLKNAMEIVVLNKLRDLKYKARIPVQKGVKLYGIMDETGILNDGEIYCTITKDGKKNAIVGNVVITRSPALHPGDITCVEAVAVPENSPLCHLHNVVVFSSRGPRDLPSQLSGGDLDGDQYDVLWDDILYPRYVCEPAAYHAPTAIDIGRPVTRSDMTRHFVSFMENDCLSRIAYLHQIMADQADEGTLHPSCLEIASLHSDAVDFSKTGIPVGTIPRFPRARPDFLAYGPQALVRKQLELNDGKVVVEHEIPDELDEAQSYEPPQYFFYESKRVLGKLYRNINEHAFLSEVQERVKAPSSEPNHNVIGHVWNHVRRSCTLIQWEHLIPVAKDIKETYEDNLIDCMYAYSTNSSQHVSEVEVFTGTILGRNGAQSKRQKEYSVEMKRKHDKDVAFTVECIMAGENENDEEEALARSVACLYVGLTTSRMRSVGEMTSFGWVAASVCLREIDKLFEIF